MAMAQHPEEKDGPQQPVERLRNLVEWDEGPNRIWLSEGYTDAERALAIYEGALIISRLAEDNARLRRWIDTEGRSCPSTATVDAALAEFEASSPEGQEETDG